MSEQKTIYKFDEFNDDEMIILFPDANESDIKKLKQMINIKINELKKSDKINYEKFSKDLGTYIRRLQTEYTNYGLKQIYEKIIKIHSLLENNPKFLEDFKIVTKIKEEYIKNKKLLSSTMLYLNKIYKELVGDKNEKGKKQKEQQNIQVQNQRQIW